MRLLSSVVLTCQRDVANPVIPLITYAIMDRASISTIRSLFENLYHEKKALVNRAKITIQRPSIMA